MATVLNKTTGQILNSVNTPDFENDDNYIINPTEEDISNNPPPEQTVADCLINALISLSTTTTEKIHSGVVTYNGANYTTTEYCFLNFDQRLNAINAGIYTDERKALTSSYLGIDATEEAIKDICGQLDDWKMPHLIAHYEAIEKINNLETIEEINEVIEEYKNA